MTPLDAEIRRLVVALTVQEYGQKPKGDGAAPMFMKRLACGPVPVADLPAMGANLVQKARAYFIHHDIRLTVEQKGGLCRLTIRAPKEKKS